MMKKTTKETICYDCKHPIKIRESKDNLLEEPFVPSGAENPDMIKAERVLSLASTGQVLCLNCLNNLISSLDVLLKESESNKQLLEAHVEMISQQMLEDDTEEPPASEIEQLQADCLEQKKLEKSQNKQFKALNSELMSLITQEQEFWQEANKFEENLIEFEESNAEVVQRTRVADEEFYMLSKVNALNDLFYISSENQTGTISGLRLGKLDNGNVIWEEVNAAWGQCVLLLSTLSKLKGFRSAQCNIYPLGSFSRLSPVQNDACRYELFCSDALLNTMIERFNAAQVLFLEGMYEFSLFLEGEDNSFKLPYKIKDSSIGDARIILDPHNKEEWTRALKYMLQNLKYLMLVCIREL